MPDPRPAHRLAPSGGIIWPAVSWEAAPSGTPNDRLRSEGIIPLIEGISALYRREIWPPLLLGGVCGRSLISDFL
jgi:hypothetical protein